MAKQSLEAYGYELDPEVEHIFTEWRKHITKVSSMHTHLK